VDNKASTTVSQSVEAVQAELINGIQEANIKVERYDYSTEEIRPKAGVPAKLHFQKDYNGGCLL
jgi:plastocyanin domain-containing protein